MSLTGKTNEEKIWNYLLSKISNKFGVAGLMGNLFAESGLAPNNLQNSYEKRLGYNDNSYTKAVDNNTYKNFVNDKAGYGLAQWTYYSRKQNLLNYAKSKKKSIGDLEMQLQFLMSELSSGYQNVLKDLKTAKSVLEASNSVLTKYECPKDQSASVKSKRASYGQVYYDKYASKTTSNSTSKTSSNFKQRTTAPSTSDKFYINYTKGGYNTCIILDNSTGFVLPNCVGYAHGRVLELLGKKAVNWKLPACNAEDWIDKAKSNGLKTGNTPKLGAVIVYSKGSKKNSSDGCGHVAVVEQINSDGSIIISESGYKSFIFRTSKVPKGYAISGYKFEGFVYPDYTKNFVATESAITKENSVPKFKEYMVKVTASALNIRKGPSTDYTVVGCIRDKGTYTIVEEESGWGRLKSGIGWICLDYTTKR